MIIFILFSICSVTNPAHRVEVSPRIVGGTTTTIRKYPSLAVLLHFYTLESMYQFCGGTIINKRTMLTAAHCIHLAPDPELYRIRVGSSMAHSGGIIHRIKKIIIHPGWNTNTLDCDIAIMHTTINFFYSKFIKPAVIADVNYVLLDNEVVLAAGWGLHHSPKVITTESDQLHHVMVRTINQAICRERYKELLNITNNMLCSGWLGVGGRDQCVGDSGGPLYHHNIVVGISSVGYKCAQAYYPGINTRVSRFIGWIQANSKSNILVKYNNVYFLAFIVDNFNITTNTNMNKK